MKNLVVAFFVLVLIVTLNTCKREVYYPDDDLIIEFGSECGWCAGEEFIRITSIKIEYERTIPCGEDQGTETKSKAINSGKWDSIHSSFDYNLFKTLKYNVCNVCADGCDEIIRVTKNDDTYEIRYSPGEEIEGIETLQQILAEILSGFNGHD